MYTKPYSIYLRGTIRVSGFGFRGAHSCMVALHGEHEGNDWLGCGDHLIGQNTTCLPLNREYLNLMTYVEELLALWVTYVWGPGIVSLSSSG